MTVPLVEGGPWRWYVLIGTTAEWARIWRDSRRIDPAQVITVRDPIELVRLRRIESGQGVALVAFRDTAPDGSVPGEIGRLRDSGAVWVSPGWWPPHLLAEAAQSLGYEEGPQ